MKVVIKTVLAEARLRAADPRPEPITRRLITMVPKHGTRVVMEARLAPAAPTAGVGEATATTAA
jgi:hypothetical protein